MSQEVKEWGLAPNSIRETPEKAVAVRRLSPFFHILEEALTKPLGRRGQSPILLRRLRKNGDSPRRFCEGF